MHFLISYPILANNLIIFWQQEKYSIDVHVFSPLHCFTYIYYVFVICGWFFLGKKKIHFKITKFVKYMYTSMQINLYAKQKAKNSLDFRNIFKCLSCRGLECPYLACKANSFLKSIVIAGMEWRRAKH